jgi:hypothetical protein
MPRGGFRERAGRRPIDINLREMEQLYSLHCTNEEVAGWFRISARTLQKKLRLPEYADAMQNGKAKGSISLRRLQWRSAEKLNPSMLQFLGKQILAQREVQPLELTGPNGDAVKLSLELINEIVQT